MRAAWEPYFVLAYGAMVLAFIVATIVVLIRGK